MGGAWRRGPIAPAGSPWQSRAMRRKPHVNVYAGGGLDRAAHLRKDEAWLAERLSDPRTRFVPVWRSRNLIAGVTATDDRWRRAEVMPGAETPGPVYLDPESHRDLIEASAYTVLLGLTGGTVHFAVDLSHIESPHDEPTLADRGAFVDLRQVGALIDRDEGALLAYARGIMTWHRNHEYCGRCGSPTLSVEAGHVRRCSDEACGAQHFPRTDPAVIMLVSHGDRCLLGRQAFWPQGMHSTLAGFVEPGESLEDAVAREVFEETGVRVREAHYHSSQPWPFPTSLMLGFHATADSEHLDVNRDELEDARWFSRDWLLANRDNKEFRMPRPDSISRQLIEAWLRGEAD